MSRLPKSSFLGVASTSQEGHEKEAPNLPGKRTLRVTLLSSEWQSTKGGVSTINRELAIQLAKHPHVDVSVYLPQCSEEDRKVAASHNVRLVEAEKLHGIEPDLWLSSLPENHVVDCVIGHGVHLGKHVQLIKRQHYCKWIQVVHTDPEELGMFKSYADAISIGEKNHQVEVKLCELSDQVVAIGPKLADAFSGYLRPFGKDQNVFNLTPGIFSEFADVKQASEERKTFSVLVFGHGENEDFQLKGYDIAAKAIAELKDVSQPYKLKLVGAPSGKGEQVRDFLLQQGIGRDQLIVRGFKEREQLAKQFCEVDLAIMPSRTEGFGLAALEALSAGLPILVSRNSGLGEALKNVLYGAHCVVADSEDPKEWAKAIRTVRQKRRDLRLKESKLLCEEYAKMYSWEKQCRLLVERMMNLTAGPSEVSQPSAVDCSHSASPTASQTELRSTTEGLPEESRPPLAEKSKRLLSPTGKQPSKRCRQELTDHYEQGFSGAHQSSVVDCSQPVFPAASQVHLRSGSEGFSGVRQSSVVDRSRPVFPAVSQAHLRSGSEGFSGGSQSSLVDRSQPVFSAVSQAHLLSGSEALNLGGSQPSVAACSQQTFPAVSQAHLTSGFEGFSGARQSLVVDRSQPVFPAASQAHLRSGSEGISAQREGIPSEYELEELSQKLGVSWKSLARHLGFHEGEITGFHKDNEEYSSKALQMLFRWKQKQGRDATYGVLYDALCDKLVGQRDLAEVFCCDQRLHRQAPNQPGFSGGSQPSVVDHSQLAFPAASQAHLRSGSEGFSGRSQSSVMDHSQLVFPAVSQAHLTSGLEGFSGGNQPSLVDHSQLPFPAASQTHLRSGPEDFYGGRQTSVVGRSQQAFPTSSQAHLRNESEGFSGSSQSLAVHHSQPVFPAGHQAHLRSGYEQGFSGGRQPSVIHGSQLVFSAASQDHLRSGYEGFSGGSQPSVVDHSQLVFPAASQAHLRSGSEGFSGGNQHSVVGHSQRVFPATHQTRLASGSQLQGFSYSSQSSVVDHRRLVFPAASRAHLRSGYEQAFLGGSQPSVAACNQLNFPTSSQAHLTSSFEGFSGFSHSPAVDRSQLAFPAASQAHLTSGSEGFSGGTQPSLVDHSQLVFPAASQAHLRSGSEGFCGGSQASVPACSQQVFPAASKAHLTSGCEGFSGARQSSVVDRSWPAFPAASQAHLRSGFEGFSGGTRSSIVDHSRPVFPAASQAHLTSGSQGQGLAFVVRLLRDTYRRRSLLKPLLWENTFKLPIEDVYTRLKIVSRRKTDFKLERNVVDMYGVFVAPDDVTVLVEGSPGIGKTTFCLKIAHDWANDKIPKEHSFPEFEVVLLLQCRDIDGDILEAINEQLLPEDEKIRKDLIDYIKEFHYGEKVLIILDGLDELPKNSKDGVDKLLHKKILPYCYVVATSRQERGIVVRQKVDFDVLLQIEGFTEVDAFEYIRKHFRHFGPEHLSKAERLIKAIQENSFLQGLPSNPLNLLLLCVVFEDYEGKLPSRRTELYQIIVRCILRRFWAKRNVEVPKDDKALERQFEESLLVLGELAWRCLLEDRHFFCEGELATFESTNKDLVARETGLVFKEASLKKIMPQHEYHFFHKTFQEYLAAYYLALKLLREEINVLSDFQVDFYDDITEKYRQVFLFVCGILGDEASILFKQIGEKFKSEDWDWKYCVEQQATFFTEGFSESGNAEQMAMVLCSFIPFPLTLDVTGDIEEGYFHGFFIVAEYCKTFSQLQHPVHLNVNPDSADEDPNFVLEKALDYLASCSSLESFSFSATALAEELATDLFKSLSENSSLLSFTLKALYSVSTKVADIVGAGLAASSSLETVTFELLNDLTCKPLVSALQKGLCAGKRLKSVVLKICGSFSDTTIQALKGVLDNQFLTSFVAIISGDMQDSLATAVGSGLAFQTVLKSFTLIVYGRLGQLGVNSLDRGVLQNSSLESLEVKVFGELPNNWATFVKSKISAKKPKQELTFHPNIKGNISDAEVAFLFPVLPNTSLNVEQSINVWGELSSAGAQALGKFLGNSPPSRLNVNFHGKVTDRVVNILTSYLKFHKTMTFLTFNIWGEMTTNGKAAIEEFSSSNYNHGLNLNIHDLMSDYGPDSLDFCIDDPSLLSSVFTKVKDSGTAKLSITIAGVSEDWARGLSDSLTSSTPLTTLDLTIRNYSGKSSFWMQGLSDGLAKNTSLTTLTLTFNNYSDNSGDWLPDLDDGLANTISLTKLTLIFNNYCDRCRDCSLSLSHGLSRNTSLTTLTLEINDCSDESGRWILVLDDGLASNKSLTTLSLTFNNCSDVSGDWVLDLGDGLARNTSLTTLTLTLTFNNSDVSGERMLNDLDDGLARNTSITTLTLTLTFNNYSGFSEEWVLGLGDGLASNRSLTTLTLTFNNYSVVGGGRMLDDLDDGLARNMSITSLTHTINNYRDVSEEWVLDLGNGLASNTSITTLTVTVNNYNNVGGEWVLGLSNGLASNTSITTLTVTINNYGDFRRDWVPRGLRDGLASNTSITTLTLTFNNYSDMSRNWMLRLGDSLAKTRSLTVLTLTINSCSEVRKDRLLELCNSLAKSESLTTLRLTVNDHSDRSGGLGFDISKSFEHCKSLTLLSLTVNLYGEENVC